MIKKMILSSKIIRYLTTLFILFFTATSMQAVSIKLDGTGGLLSGTDCQAGAQYRFGTENSYNGQAIDLLVDVLNSDNDYAAGACVFATEKTLATRLRDMDSGDNIAYQEYQITLVQQGTTIPLEVDRLMLTAYDLDINSGTSVTDTDDFYVAADNAFISSGSSVIHTQGSFYTHYTDKLKGWNGGNCDDTASTPDVTCRASSIWINGNGLNRVSTVRVRVQNDNAYGDHPTDSENWGAHRLIQLSFQIEDFADIFNGQKEYGDAPSNYGAAGSALDGTIMLGSGLPADQESSYQNSSDATADDSDTGGLNYDDDDAISLSGTTLSGQTLGTGESVTLDITTYGSGYLQGWFDWNSDGDFEDSGEHVISGHQIINSGESSGNITTTNASSGVTQTALTITIPATAITGNTFARFRFSETNSANERDPRSDISLKGEVEDYQLGIVAMAAVSGSVQTSANNPIANVSLQIMNGTSVVNDTDGNPLQTTTDTSGNYSFTKVPVGSFTIVQTQPSGYNSVSDTEGANDDQINLLINPGQNYTNNNFVEVQFSGTVSGSVHDINANPLSNVTVHIEDGSNNIVNDINGNPLTTTTDNSGNYSFTNVPAGNFEIIETDPTNYMSQSDGDNSFDDGSFSNHSQTDNRIPLVITDGKNDSDNNFIDQMIPATVSGSVQTPANTAIPNVTITIEDGSGNVISDINSNPLTTTTDASGNYSFTDIPAGSYVIKESDLTNYSSVSDVDGANDNTIAITVVSGQSYSNRDFVDTLPTGTIAGLVKDNHDTPLANVSVQIFESDGTTPARDNNGVIVPTATTDSLGNFSFTNMPADNYLLIETNPTNYLSVDDQAGDEQSTNSSQSDDTIPVTLGFNEIDDDNIFIDQIENKIIGNVYTDNNADGTPDGPLQGVTIDLNDCAGNSYHDTTTTDVNGEYRFSGVVPNCYIITESDPVGYQSVSDIDGNNPNTITLTMINTTITGQDFIDEPTVSLSGTVRADVDYDATTDQPLSGVKIQLRDNSDILIGTATTDQNGLYQFDDITPGNYTIKELDPSGYGSLRDIDGANDNMINLTVSTSNITGQDFDDQKRITVSGTVKVDINGDKIVDEPLKNADLELQDSHGNVIQTSQTDDQGHYEFTDLEPGSYTIVEVDKPGYESLSDIDGANDNIINIDLTGTGNVTGQDFENLAIAPQFITLDKQAEKKEASIGGFVPYSIRVENQDETYNYSAVTIQDTLPSGFKYVEKSARITRNGQTSMLNATGEQVIEFGTFALHAGESLQITYLLKVGVAVAHGEHINKAVAVQNGEPVSTEVKASVKIIADSFADNATLIGKVFADNNENGIQDEEELGIPGVRLATVEGLLIETDGFGRYHVADVESGGFGSRGKNFIIKIDPFTLPDGAIFTTENPRVYRITSGQLNVVNFGVKLPEQEYASKMVEVMMKKEKKRLVKKTKSLGSIYFDSDQDCIRPDQVKKLKKMAQTLKDLGGGEIMIEGNTDARAPIWYNKKLAYKRAKSVYQELKYQLGDEAINSVDVLYDNCESEVVFDPRYDWWGKPNAPKSKKECTQLGKKVDCNLPRFNAQGGVL